MKSNVQDPTQNEKTPKQLSLESSLCEDDAVVCNLKYGPHILETKTDNPFKLKEASTAE